MKYLINNNIGQYISCLYEIITVSNVSNIDIENALTEEIYTIIVRPISSSLHWRNSKLKRFSIFFIYKYTIIFCGSLAKYTNVYNPFET